MRNVRRLSIAGMLGAWLLALALALAPISGAHAATLDITGQFAITRSGLLLNRSTNTFDSTAKFTNSSSAPVLGPVAVVVNGLPSAVTLANATGYTPDGRPYVTPLAAGSLLSSGGSLSFLLKFSNPKFVSFTSTLQALYTYEVPPGAPSLIAVVATGGTGAYVIGRVEGAPNRDIALQASTAATCVMGTLVSGTAAGGPVAARTDASGYFGATLSGVNPGQFVAVKMTSPATTASSGCLVSARDNDSWPKAFPIDGSAATVRDYIDAPGKARWYKFAVTPGQRIDVKLSGLPADYDLAVFRDIGQVFANEFKPGAAQTNDLLKLTAEYAPTVFSPTVFSPTVFSPTVFSPDAYAPTVFSPTVFSPTVFSPTVFSPTVFSPTVFSPTVFSPTVFSPTVFSPTVFSPTVFSPTVFSQQEIAQAFSTAQTRSIIAVSATAGTGDEGAVVNTWNRTGYFYARVTGRGGAFSTSIPFTLSVTKGATSCAAVTDTALTPRSVLSASGLRTVILTDSSKLALDAPLPDPSGATLRSKLAAFATRSEIQGVVVDVANDSRVKTLRQQAANNPACPFAKNLVAEEIKGIVDSYRSNPLQYVVIVGNDDAIPFFRSPDQSGLGQESGYIPPVQSNSSSEASLRLDFVLSQDRYGSRTTISLPWNDFPVPGLAVGRLVETAPEIAGLIDAYAAASSVVAPHSSLVTGYDFLEDAASAVKSELDAGTGTTGDALITPNGKSPQDPASWTAAQLRTRLFGTRHDVIFLAGHFSANSALAADFATSVLTTDLAASTTDFTNSIVFSAGCHAGYSLVDSDAILGVTLPLDWAQAFARKKATLIAGTGYQYGDTDFLEYSERLYKNFARQLRAGSGAVPVGDALVKAKLAYLAATPDIRGLHEKALLEATLFGLPMLGVNMPAGRDPGTGTSAAIDPVPVGSGPAATLGLRTYDLGVAPGLTPHTQALRNLSTGSSVTASWLSGPDGVVSKNGEPVLPLDVINVTPSDPTLVLRGIGYRGGTFVDSAPLYPFTGAPTMEARGVHVPFVSPVDYPTTMWTPNYFGALAGAGGTQLLVTPVQHRAASITDGTSTQRRHTGMNLRLFYSGNLSQAALSDAPSIVAVDAKGDASAVTFTAQVVGDPAASIHQVWVTYAGDGTGAWTSLDLAQCVVPLPAACGGTEDSRLWSGLLASPPVKFRYFVQAVSGVGLVARSDNLGAYYSVGVPTPPATSLALVSAPSTVTVGATASVTAKLTYSGGVAVAGKVVAVAVGGSSRLGTTGSDGTVIVEMPVVSTAGSYPLTAVFAGDDAFLASSASASVSFVKAAATTAGVAPAVAPAGISVTGSIDGTTTALQQVPVAFTVTGPAGTTTVWATTDNLGNAILPPPSGLPAGTYTVTQASYGGDGTYAPTTVKLSQQFTVAKLNQTISFDPLATRTLGDPDFGVYATASSGLAVSYGAGGACTIAGNVVHLTGIGSCTITASQAGDANTNPAVQAARSFSIIAPLTVASLVRAVPSPTMADSVTYTLTFSEAVTGVTAANLAVTTTGINGASIATVSGTGATRTVTVNTGRGTGTLRLDVVNGTGITVGSGAVLGGLPFSGETYQIDKGGTVLGTGEGQPVAGFGVNGYALFSDVQVPTAPGRIRERSNGRIVAVGGTACAANVNPGAPAAGYCTVQLAQYLATGAPDTSFGTGGRVVTTLTNANADLNFSILGDGSLVVRGYRYNGSADVPFVAKFTSTGAPDATFGTGGVVQLDALPIGFGIIGSDVDSSGRIVIVGTTPNLGPQGQDVFATRLTSTGGTDTTFGTNGVAQYSISTTSPFNDRGTTFNIQPDGFILIGGRTIGASGAFDFLVMRISSSGALDPTFGTNGIVTTRLAGTTGDNLGRRMALQPDGKIVMVGSVIVGAATQCGIVRYNTNGSLDAGFGTGGQVLVPVSIGCFDVTQQPDGKLVITGNDKVGDVGYGTLIRLQLSGALDTGFGTNGYQRISNYDTPGRVAVTSGGNLLTSLTIQDPADGIVKSYVVELTTTLTGPWVGQTISFPALPDTTFGVQPFALTATTSSGLAISYSASGACSVAGLMVQTNGLGSCTITASQPGNATYFPASSVSQTFTIAKAAQAITFGQAPANATVGQPLVMVAATSTSPAGPPSTIPIQFGSLTQTVCTVSGGFNMTPVNLVGQGTCIITADQAGNTVYSAAQQQTLSFPVGAAGAAPVTFTVSNLLDDNSVGSLRWAIQQANTTPGPNVVNFASGLTGTITLTLGQLQISGPTQIVGPGAANLTIDGNANGRIFSVFNVSNACPSVDLAGDYLVSISGLRLTNARRTSSGGAIYSEHSLILDSMVVEGNLAYTGGGLYFGIQYPGQTLTITNSQFRNNIIAELSPPSATATTIAGGGVYVAERCTDAQDNPHTWPAAVTIANSTFSGNSVQPSTLDGRGGGIRSWSRADFFIVDTVVTDNHVIGPATLDLGATYYGGGIEGLAASWRIERSEISANTAFDPNYSQATQDSTRGGGARFTNNAVEWQSSAGRTAVKIVNSTFSGNFANATFGAVALNGNVAAELINTTVSNNASAPGRTGGIGLSQNLVYPTSAAPSARPEISLVSSIVANSSSTSSSNETDFAAGFSTFGPFVLNASNSLVEKFCGGSTCTISVVGSGSVAPGIDPLLGPLTNNGGTTRTHALLPGSPAINTGSNPLGLATDQRGTGFPRVSGGTPDMGAYESP